MWPLSDDSPLSLRERDGVRVPVPVFTLCLLFSGTACLPASPCGPERGFVSEVIDGDTIVLSSGERVRYLLVDTPESTRGKHECFGAEAQSLNRSLVEGRVVDLAYGEACTDRYGRLLAYVFVEGQEVNAQLAARGHACVLYVPPAGESRRDDYKALEAAAKRARRGLWGACADVPCGR
jgi:micrococcal nuclease